MHLVPNEYQLNIEWTLPLCVRKLDPVLGWKLAHVHDLDATLTIHYWEIDDRRHEWEVSHARIDGIIVTKDSDPIAWALVERAVKHDFDAMHERIQERIHECAEAA